MQVISGFLKGQALKGYHLKKTRPTMAKVKESLFAIIQSKLKDSLCLDLFAGSGSLGIEAISHGARMVYFNDNNKSAINIINENINHLKIKKQAFISLKDYQVALLYFKKHQIKFDLIFLDPPYDQKIIELILFIISDYQLLNKNGQVICFYQDDYLKEIYNDLYLVKYKRYGVKRINIYQLK